MRSNSKTLIRPFKIGLFRSDIRINGAGNPFVQEIRSGSVARVFDNDMFSSGWIITVLLEANLYGTGAPQLDETNLRLALEGKKLYFKLYFNYI
jgi:hypothetical protein